MIPLHLSSHGVLKFCLQYSSIHLTSAKRCVLFISLIGGYDDTCILFSKSIPQRCSTVFNCVLFSSLIEQKYPRAYFGCYARAPLHIKFKLTEWLPVDESCATSAVRLRNYSTCIDVDMF